MRCGITKLLIAAALMPDKPTYAPGSQTRGRGNSTS
jgi:hypothetical protein